MTNDAPAMTPEPALAAADVSVPVILSSWDRIERWILVGLFVFGLSLPFAGAILASLIL